MFDADGQVKTWHCWHTLAELRQSKSFREVCTAKSGHWLLKRCKERVWARRSPCRTTPVPHSKWLNHFSRPMFRFSSKSAWTVCSRGSSLASSFPSFCVCCTRILARAIHPPLAPFILPEQHHIDKEPSELQNSHPLMCGAVLPNSESRWIKYTNIQTAIWFSPVSYNSHDSTDPAYLEYLPNC